MLSISQRALDYLIATRRLPTRRIGGRVLIPVSELRKYARHRSSRADRGLGPFEMGVIGYVFSAINGRKWVYYWV
jgi:hypothetical protein